MPEDGRRATDRPADATSADVVAVDGGVIEYADGAEARVHEALSAVSDRSSTSDELMAYISDWPTEYHLSRDRANLLRVLRFPVGSRIIDYGAGTGVLARHLAERGAHVLAVEGSPARARLAALRCEAFPTVRVIAGDLRRMNALQVDGEPADAALCIGLFEYIAAAGADAGRPFLARARAEIGERGVLILAIENQIGLKYLLGSEEDHLGRPWVGLEGYAGETHARTFVRRQLQSMLGGAGFPHQHWLYPFPDYKLPTTVLSDEIYHREDVSLLVDALVRWPGSTGTATRARVADERRVHRVLLDAGLGRETANSFLIVAGQSPSAIRRFVNRRTLAWHFGGNRQARWRAEARLRPSTGVDNALVMLARRPSNLTPTDGWLSQARRRRRAFIAGPTVEQLALDACSPDAAPLAAILREWRVALQRRECLATADGGTSPFAAHAGHPMLPPDHLDLVLANFVRSDAGALEFIDSEWRADGAVDAALVMFRALWWFAFELVTRGMQHPWGAEATVHGIAGHLALVAGVPESAITLDSFLAAEADLQSRVYGGDAGTFERTLREYANRSQAVRSAAHPSTRLLEALDDRTRTVAQLTAAIDTARQTVVAQQEMVRERGEAAERMTHALEMATQRADTLSGLIAEIHASRIWRWTGWVRRLGTVIHGGRP